MKRSLLYNFLFYFLYKICGICTLIINLSYSKILQLINQRIQFNITVLYKMKRVYVLRQSDLFKNMLVDCHQNVINAQNQESIQQIMPIKQQIYGTYLEDFVIETQIKGKTLPIKLNNQKYVHFKQLSGNMDLRNTIKYPLRDTHNNSQPISKNLRNTIKYPLRDTYNNSQPISKNMIPQVLKTKYNKSYINEANVTNLLNRKKYNPQANKSIQRPKKRNKSAKISFQSNLSSQIRSHQSINMLPRACSKFLQENNKDLQIVNIPVDILNKQQKDSKYQIELFSDSKDKIPIQTVSNQNTENLNQAKEQLSMQKNTPSNHNLTISQSSKLNQINVFQDTKIVSNSSAIQQLRIQRKTIGLIRHNHSKQKSLNCQEQLRSNKMKQSQQKIHKNQKEITLLQKMVQLKSKKIQQVREQNTVLHKQNQQLHRVLQQLKIEIQLKQKQFRQQQIITKTQLIQQQFNVKAFAKQLQQTINLNNRLHTLLNQSQKSRQQQKLLHIQQSQEIKFIKQQNSDITCAYEHLKQQLAQILRAQENQTLLNQMISRSESKTFRTSVDSQRYLCAKCLSPVFIDKNQKDTNQLLDYHMNEKFMNHVRTYQEEVLYWKEEIKFMKTQHQHEIQNIKTVLECTFQKLLIKKDQSNLEIVRGLRNQIAIKEQQINYHRRFNQAKMQISMQHERILKHKNMENQHIIAIQGKQQNEYKQHSSTLNQQKFQPITFYQNSAQNKVQTKTKTQLTQNLFNTQNPTYLNNKQQENQNQQILQSKITINNGICQILENSKINQSD